jgi:hypothetical protein
MTFDDWCATCGSYLNDSDDAARAARLMARLAWDAAVAAERELAAKARKLEAENKRLRKALIPMIEGLVFLSHKNVEAARKALGLPEPVFS